MAISTGHLLSLVALLLFALNIILVRVATEGHPQRSGFMVALCANVVVLVGVLAITVIVGHEVTWDRGAAAAFVLAGLLTTFLGRSLLFRAISEIGASRASAIQVTNPLFALVIGVTFLGDKITSVQLLCMLAVLAGLYLTSRVARPALVASMPDAVASTAASTAAPRMAERLTGGVATALFAAISYGAGSVVRATSVRSWDEPVLGTLLGAIAATGLYGVVVTRPRELCSSLVEGEARSISLWILSGVLTAIAQVCVTAASGLIPVGVVLVISSAFPIVVLPISTLLLQNTEGVTATTVAGALVIVGGISVLILRGG